MKIRILTYVLLFITLPFITAWAGLTKSEVSQLYVSVLNRASEGEGNTYWQSEPDMATAATAMLETDAAENYFGASLSSNQAFIEHIYRNTFNKTLADDPAGIAYWVAELNKGTRGQVVASLVESIRLYSPVGLHYDNNDSKTIAAYNQFTNRVLVSDYMADQVEKPPTNWATVTRFSSNGLYVTEDSSTVDESKKVIDYLGTGWKYLVEATDLQSVDLYVIKSSAIIKGLQEFNKYFKHNIKAIRLVYKTLYKGKEIYASGLMCIPLSDGISYPLLIAQNGMLFADRLAPSNFDFPNTYIGLEFIASAGYFVLIPDWIGFGASSEILYPMYNAKYAASTTIDMIKAAEEYIITNKLLLNDQTFISGYSMGGFVACASLKAIEEKNLRTITATALGAGGYNLPVVMEHTFAGENILLPSQLAMFFTSYNSTYDWERPLSDFFNQPYATQIPDLISGSYDADEIDEQLPKSINDLFSPLFINRLVNDEETRLVEALEENSVYDWAPRSLLRLYHSNNDERVPLSDSLDTYKAMKAAGSDTVDFQEISGDGHFDAVFSFMKAVLPWFESLKKN